MRHAYDLAATGLRLRSVIRLRPIRPSVCLPGGEPRWFDSTRSSSLWLLQSAVEIRSCAPHIAGGEPAAAAQEHALTPSTAARMPPHSGYYIIRSRNYPIKDRIRGRPYMKPSTSALIGAVIISGGCVSLPAVAFATDTIATTRIATEKNILNGGAAQATDEASTCHADTHGHASSCTCARCVAAQAE